MGKSLIKPPKQPLARNGAIGLGPGEFCYHCTFAGTHSPTEPGMHTTPPPHTA